MQQLQLFSWMGLSDEEKASIYADIRRVYWFIRQSRKGYNQAARRRYYRQAAAHKKRLLMAGVEKREILDFLAECRNP